MTPIIFLLCTIVVLYVVIGLIFAEKFLNLTMTQRLLIPVPLFIVAAMALLL